MNLAHVELKIWSGHDAAVIPEFLKSASEAHGVPAKSPQWFTWKFGDSPWGPAIIAYAQTPSGQVAGAVAFGTYRLNSGGTVLDAGISYETFVHADFRRRGLFSALLDAAEGSARERGLSLLINFPNSASRKGFLNTGWSDIGGIQTWIRPVSPTRSIRALLGVARTGRTFVPSGSIAPLSRERLAASIEGRMSIATLATYSGALWREHNPEFLFWRFSTSMAGQYETVESEGMSALVRLGTRGGRRETQVLDVFSAGPAGTREIRSLMRSVASDTGTDFLSILATPCNPLTSRLPLLGFVPIPNSINFFAKSLNPTVSMETSRRDLAITGVDIHTW